MAAKWVQAAVRGKRGGSEAEHLKPAPFHNQQQRDNSSPSPLAPNDQHSPP